MSFIYWGVNKGQHQTDVTLASASDPGATTDVLLRVYAGDVQAGNFITREEVIRGLIFIRNVIRQGTWPPIALTASRIYWGWNKGQHQTDVTLASTSDPGATTDVAVIVYGTDVGQGNFVSSLDVVNLLGWIENVIMQGTWGPI